MTPMHQALLMSRGVPDPLFSSVVYLNYGQGLDLGTTFRDDSPLNATLTRTGSAVTSTAQFIYGTSSIRATQTASAEGVATPTNSNYQFLLSPLTVEGWVRFTDLPTAPGNQRHFMRIDGSSGFSNQELFGYLAYSSPSTAELHIVGFGADTWLNNAVTGVWYNFVYTFDGTNHRCGITPLGGGGVLSSSIPRGSSVTTNSRIVIAGPGVGAPAATSGCHIGPVRVTKAVRYPVSGAQQSAAFPWPNF